MGTTYTATRPIMGSAELATHKATAHGRDYTTSQDGYEDIEQAERTGWHSVPSWGRDGWDLGKWPYVSLQVRRSGEAYQLQQICEGDHDVYTFDSEADLYAALDYLFLWYAADEEWAPLTWEQRETLDQGAFEVDPKFRGPFSWARCDAESEAVAL